jgi:hypothetical protein
MLSEKKIKGYKLGIICCHVHTFFFSFTHYNVYCRLSFFPVGFYCELSSLQKGVQWLCPHGAFCDSGRVQNLHCPIHHAWFLSTWNVASATPELNFKFYLILINLNSYKWLTSLFDSTGVENNIIQNYSFLFQQILTFGHVFFRSSSFSHVFSSS